MTGGHTLTRNLRERLGVTQAEMARAIGAAGKLAISHYENQARIPSGVVMRFMSYLMSLSDPELKRVTARLLLIADEEERK